MQDVVRRPLAHDSEPVRQYGSIVAVDGKMDEARKLAWMLSQAGLRRKAFATASQAQAWELEQADLWAEEMRWRARLRR